TPVPPTPVTPSPAPPSPTTAPDPTPTAGLAVLSATETTATSARLRWPAARTGTRYGVVLNSRTLGWTTATGSRLTGLRADTEYRVQVVLRSAGATTPYTGVLTLRTPSAAPPAAGAWFRLGNALTGEVADLYAGRAADRTPVVLRRGAGATSEQWRLEPAAGGTFLLRSRASGKCVTPLGGTAATGAPLVQAVCAPAAAGQRWRLTAGARGITLTAAGTDLVVGLGGSRFGGAGRLLVLQRPAGGAAQAWAAGPVD
ncbi:MAG TPA: RICIN domain-containing protein, partial [Pilimelia sp.]|nr:RICIN domain-containing protein [Pilimelia sp.]